MRPLESPLELLLLLKDPSQDYQLSPLSDAEVEQLKRPYIVRLQDSGEIESLLTAANETIRSLTIKNQVARTILPNKVKYLSFLNVSGPIEWDLDLSTLPFRMCNATVQVNSTQDVYLFNVTAGPANCNVLSFGGGQITPDSFFNLQSTFNKVDFSLQERRENTSVTIISEGGRAEVAYEYHVHFANFAEKEDWNISDLKVKDCL